MWSRIATRIPSKTILFVDDDDDETQALPGERRVLWVKWIPVKRQVLLKMLPPLRDKRNMTKQSKLDTAQQLVDTRIPNALARLGRSSLEPLAKIISASAEGR